MGVSRVSRASPTAASFAEGGGLRGFREHGVDGHLQRDCAVKAVRGAWGVFEALAHSRLAVAHEILSLRDRPERALRRSENLPFALLPCQLTAGGRQLRGEPVSHCHLAPHREATQQSPGPW